MNQAEKNIKFHTYSKSVVCDEAHTADFVNALRFKKVYAGSLGLYHKELFRRYFIPYSDIRRIYKQVQIIPVDDSPAYEHYRIIIQGAHGRITEILFGEGFMNRTEDNDLADQLLEAVRHIDNASHIHIGYEA